jgi:hypothetical protein
VAVIDPILLLTEILQSYGHTDVNSDQIESRALAPNPEYIFLQLVGGVTPHVDRVDRPTVEIVIYTKDPSPNGNGFATARAAGTRVQSELRDAWGKPFTNGGIHKVITRLRPYRQDIPGLPYGVGRTVAQYDFVFANSEKWV